MSRKQFEGASDTSWLKRSFTFAPGGRGFKDGEEEKTRSRVETKGNIVFSNGWVSGKFTVAAGVNRDRLRSSVN